MVRRIRTEELNQQNKAGLYPRAVDDSADVQCGTYGGFSERAVSDPDIEGLFAGEAKLYRSLFLGASITLRFYGESVRAGNPGVNEKYGTRIETPGADKLARFRH